MYFKNTYGETKKGVGKYEQGYFIPEFPRKYQGDINKIFYRSSWEKIFMRKFCDLNPDCVLWSSEEHAIPYYNPLDKKQHRYFVDFFVVVRQEDRHVGLFIEIKPSKQLKQPMLKEGYKTTKRVKRYNKEVEEYIKNMAKWKAAKEFAKERGCEFLIITEKQLNFN